MPVKVSAEIPKERIFDVMKEINRTVVMAPKKRGDILIENAAGTGVSVIATRDIAIRDIEKRA